MDNRDTDTISRQAAYDTLTEYYHHKTDMQHKALAEALSRVPPSPSRPKGRWKTIAFLTTECSECHAQIHELEYGNFCPNCGADMRQNGGTV